MTNCKAYLGAFLALIFSLPLAADVVRPALIEISVFTTGKVEIELRVSIEALLTGINGRYKNTQDAPNAEEYDHYRVMQADQLLAEFESFRPVLLESIDLQFDSTSIALDYAEVNIPEPGYTKVPRISVIHLQGQADRANSELRWYYPMRFGDHATRVRQVDEANELWHWSDHQWIKKDTYTEPYLLNEIFTRQPWWNVLQSYTVAGFQHILPLGLDHILFVLGIFLLSERLKPLLWQVTMFTVAHSITLSMAMLGVFSASPAIVEPLIALSIAYVAVENILRTGLHASRLWIVFGFGLLHGLGFASMLAEFGMPREHFALALISFNIGIETGQIAVILVAYFGLAVWFRNEAIYRKVVVIPASLLISIIGLFWFWDRWQWDAIQAVTG